MGVYFRIDSTTSGFLQTEVDTVFIKRLSKNNEKLDSTFIFFIKDSYNISYQFCSGGHAFSLNSFHETFEYFNYEIQLKSGQKFIISDIVNVVSVGKDRCCSCTIADRKTFKLDGKEINLLNEWHYSIMLQKN